MGQRVWRGGMIGAGAWSATQLTAWSRVPNARIVALADRHPDRRDPVVQQYGIPHAFDSAEAMLDRADLDFVDVCTRPYAHAALVRLAADRGLPVLCQKPFCATLEEARGAVDYAERARIRLMVNENFRWQPWHRTAKALLAGGTLGRPFLAVLHLRRRLSLPHFDHDQRYFTEMPRLLLYEVGTHHLDVMRFLFGEPESVCARLHRVSPDLQGEDVQVILLGYPDLTCLIYDSWASVPIPDLDRPPTPKAWVPRLLEIDATEGTLSLRADGSVHVYTDGGGRHWDAVEDGMPRAHAAAQQHFIDCLESGAEFETSGRETLRTMALVYACYRSAAEGRVVSPAELLAAL